jgi:hypothetical protein
MTNEEFYRINALKDEIETYEKILENRKHCPETGFALPFYSSLSFGVEPTLYPIRDETLNKNIDKLVKERLEQLRSDFSKIQIM